MHPRFPGMNPWLEHPAIWLNVHNSLITAIRDDLAAKVAPKYYIGVEESTYLSVPDGSFLGRPDLVIARTRSRTRTRLPQSAQPAPELELDPDPEGGVGVMRLDVDVPSPERVTQWYLAIRTARTGKVVTVIEILSPANKAAGPGRNKYLRKRNRILESNTSLVEIDLLRGGRPMPVHAREEVHGAYRILISRGRARPRAELYAFGVRLPIPTIAIPLLPKDPEPPLPLNDVLHALCERARFDLVTDYSRPPVPPLEEKDFAWARAILSTQADAM